MTLHEWARRLALGTAQFGMDYGVSNQCGKVSRSEAGKILDEASFAGIRALDTASSYGDSEEVIGALITPDTAEFDIVTKLPPNCPPGLVETNVGESLRRLGVEHLYGVLTHRFEDFANVAVRDALCRCKTNGQADRVGVSVYFPREIEWLLERNIPLDLVQMPFNAFDQRFQSILPDLKDRGIEVHARSVFLQGLFFLPGNLIRQQFPAAYEPVRRFSRMCSDHGFSLWSALLNYAVSIEAIDKVLIGVTSREELQKNLGCYRDFEACTLLGSRFTAFALDDEDIILPYNWS